MGQRKYGRPRCEGCGLHHERCLCGEFPRLDLATRVVVVQQIRERFKPTNTGKLVPATLVNSELVTYGLRDQAFPVDSVRPEGYDTYLLFPRDDSLDLDALPAPVAGRSRCFVVLDGTWHQCSRMSRRVPGLEDLPLVRLPAGPPSQWVARRQHDPRGVSTFEAAMRLLSSTEGEAAIEPLERFFARLVTELRALKGMV